MPINLENRLTPQQKRLSRIESNKEYQNSDKGVITKIKYYTRKLGKRRANTLLMSRNYQNVEMFQLLQELYPQENVETILEWMSQYPSNTNSGLSLADIYEQAGDIRTYDV